MCMKTRAIGLTRLPACASPSTAGRDLPPCCGRHESIEYTMHACGLCIKFDIIRLLRYAQIQTIFENFLLSRKH